MGPLTVDLPQGAVAVGAPKDRAMLEMLALRAGHAASDLNLATSADFELAIDTCQPTQREP